MPEQPPFRIDARAVRQHYSHRAHTSAQVEAIPREVASRMQERLDYIRIPTGRILDLGCGGGADRHMLQARYPDAAHIGVDFALPPLRLQQPRPAGLLSRLLRRNDAPLLASADALALPFASRSFAMVWSNLMLNWLDDPLPALKEANRVLDIGGLLMFSTLGPDTLKELRSAFPATSVHRFIDMHDLGDALVKAGFGDPVMDMQMLTVTYPSARELLADLRLGGHASAHAARPRGLMGREAWQRSVRKLEALARNGSLPATLELVFGHAWKVAPKSDELGRAIVRFEKRPG